MKTKYLISFIIIFYGVGILGLSLPATREFFISLIPLTILMSNILLIIYHIPKQIKYLLVFSFVLIAGFMVEALGVNTGYIFGEYSYTDVLGWQLFKTPLIIGFNWAMLIYMVWTIMIDWKISSWIKVSLASMLMVLYDIVLEPFAIVYRMWTWPEAHPPFQNYAAWFFVSFLFFVMVWKSKVEMKNALAKPLFLIQLSFFTILFIINSL